MVWDKLIGGEPKGARQARFVEFWHPFGVQPLGGSMVRFPISDLLDGRECYAFLLHSLHPDGLCCPRGHRLPMGQAPRMRDRAPVVDYRCRECGAVFNLICGDRLGGYPLFLCQDRLDPARIRPGDPHLATGRRVGV